LVKPGDHYTSGHCYIIAEASFHLYGKKHGFKPKVIKTPTWTHWFLQHQDGRKIDLSAEQFGKTRIPYELSRGCGFLTKLPSKRAQKLIRNLQLLS